MLCASVVSPSSSCFASSTLASASSSTCSAAGVSAALRRHLGGERFLCFARAALRRRLRGECFFPCEVFASDGRCDACVWGRSPDDGKVGAVKWLKVVESINPAHSGDMGEATNHSYRRPGGILSTAQEHGTRNDRGIEHALDTRPGNRTRPGHMARQTP